MGLLSRRLKPVDNRRLSGPGGPGILHRLVAKIEIMLARYILSTGAAFARLNNDWIIILTFFFIVKAIEYSPSDVLSN